MNITPGLLESLAAIEKAFDEYADAIARQLALKIDRDVMARLMEQEGPPPRDRASVPIID